MNYSVLLDRQIKKFLSQEMKDSEELRKFLKVVSDTYYTLERDRELAENAFTISEHEYGEATKRLSKELGLKKQSIESLKKTLKVILGESYIPSDDLLNIAQLLDEQVTTRKNAEEVFLSLVNNFKSGVLLEDEDRNIKYTNQLFCDFFGIAFDPSELVGENCYILASGVTNQLKDPDFFVKKLDSIIAEKKMVLGETYELKDGRILNRDFIPVFVEGRYKGHLWVYTDITEAKKTERVLLESEQRNRLIMNSALDAIIHIDIAGKITFWNPRAEEIFGWKKDEVIGTLLSDTIIPHQHKNTHHTALKHHNQQHDRLSNVLNKHIELPAINKQGDQMIIELYIIPIDQNDQRMFCSFIRDVTARKKERAEIERLSLVASANENGIYIVNNEGIITWVNQGLCNMTGFTQAEMLGQNPMQFFQAQNSRFEVVEDIRARAQEKKPINGEYQIRCKNIDYIWTRVNAQVINADAHESGYFVMMEDITEEKAVEEKLSKYKERLQYALINIGDNYWEHDFNSGNTFFSNLENSLLGYDINEIENYAELWWKSVLEEDRPLLVKSDIMYKDGTQDRHSLEYRIRLKDGSIRWVLDRGVVTEFDEDKMPLRIIGTHVDITKTKMMEVELRRAKEFAEASTKSKEMFLANMSHEIRTPMNAILGLTGQLQKTMNNPQQKAYLNHIQAASEHLLTIINDILDISKIEAGQLSIEKINFDPKHVLQDAMMVFHHKAEEKGLYLQTSYCDPRLAPSFIGDPFRLKQIILNLMSNAIKFTEKGGVSLSCEVLEDGVNHQVTQLSIMDTGIGMDGEFSKNLFQKFKQEDESVTRKFGGTGLGMSISKELIELMGGEIFVESEKNKGTTVKMRIPFLKGNRELIPQKSEVVIPNLDALTGKTIIIADDNEMNRLVATTILENYEISIMEAENGKEVLTILENTTPDLILMDIQMPEMDGIQATREIRKTNQHVPIIALTAYALSNDGSKFLNEKMNDYMSKPFSEMQLLTMLVKWLDKEIQDSQNSTPFYSISKLKEIAGDNQVFISKMIKLFVDTTPDVILQLQAAYDEDRLNDVARLAHRIKPSIDNMMILGLSEPIREIEHHATVYGKGEKLEQLLEKTIGTLQKAILEMKKNIKE